MEIYPKPMPIYGSTNPAAVFPANMGNGGGSVPDPLLEARVTAVENKNAEQDSKDEDHERLALLNGGTT